MKHTLLILALTLPFTPALAEPLDTFRDCDVCPEMIELPVGDFIMGAPEDEFRRNLVWRDGAHHRATAEHPFVKTDEGPQHKVTVDNPIAMGRNEVTYDEWMACVNDGGCGGYVPRSSVPIDRHGRKYDATGNNSVLFISYDDALSYIDWLNDKTGSDAYRLPTEAEWEYAARAGTTTRFAQGDEITSQQANFHGGISEIVLIEKRPDFLSRNHPVPVDTLDAANPWGLRHMSGNARELTLSCYTETYVGWSTTSQWLENSDEDNCMRVVRGASYGDAIDLLRVAWRSQHGASERLSTQGFRVVKDLRPEN
ncbi:formylglycine-generating enzyme family protein [Pseudaestuariivita rosea]|uniref:formylglycine-generating enzyme family protein n=1 Tax=Pseudaestuariivita rosea TaxID=2763263 RepID=UPI001ABA45EF|nr:formylglycine-generating enzyme family protein [Pseudaestuariivita rosea]